MQFFRMELEWIFFIRYTVHIQVASKSATPTKPRRSPIKRPPSAQPRQAPKGRSRSRSRETLKKGGTGRSGAHGGTDKPEGSDAPPEGNTGGGAASGAGAGGSGGGGGGKDDDVRNAI